MSQLVSVRPPSSYEPPLSQVNLLLFDFLFNHYFATECPIIIAPPAVITDIKEYILKNK